MTNLEKLQKMTASEMAAELLFFRPSDRCFEDENRNYGALDRSWHDYSQDAFRANLAWLEQEVEHGTD